MNLKELPEDIISNNYLVSSFSDTLKQINKLFYNDKSLSKNEVNDLVINLFKNNIDKIDLNELANYIELLNLRYHNDDSFYHYFNNYFFQLNLDKIFELFDILNEKEYLSDNEIKIYINYLINNGILTEDLFTKLLDYLPYVDINEFMNLITKLDNKYLDILSRYDSNIINYLSEDKISKEMLENTLKDKNYNLCDKTPSEIINNKENLKKIIANNPKNIKYSGKLINDKELLNIAITNGFEITYNDFINNGLFNDNLLLKELNNYFKDVNDNNNGISYKIILNKENDNDNIIKIYNLLKYAINNNISISKSIEYINNSKFSLILDDFNTANLDLSFIYSNKNFILSIMKSLSLQHINSITFEPDETFVKKYYENGHYIELYSSDYIKNSKLMVEEVLKYDKYQISSAIKYGNSMFINKEYIDKAINKNVNILSDSVYEITDTILKDEFINQISKLDNDKYKNFIEYIVQKAGYSVYYVEKDNILSKDMYNEFDENTITKIIRNLVFCNDSIDFRTIISNNNLNLFKRFYYDQKNNNNILEFKFLKEYFDNNELLIKELYKENLTEEEQKGFNEYIHHKDILFNISSKKHLINMNKNIYDVNKQFIDDKETDISVMKSIIFSSLFNLSYNEIKNFLGIFNSEKIKILKNEIKTDDNIKILDYIEPIIDFIESIYNMNDKEELRAISNNCNEYYYNFNDKVNEIKNIFNYIEEFGKSIYTEELNNKLTKLDQKDYIEFEEDSYFLAHVMNAFGNGSTLEDFKDSRFLGKTYICLSAIGRGINPYKRKEIDRNHVTLLFNNIPNKSLISMSSSDMASYGDIGQLDVKVKNNFNTLFNILDNTKEYIPNEYVVYRENEKGESLYPCGVLVVDDIASKEEKEASEYLNVPLVKRKNIERKRNDTQEISIKESTKKQENEFYKAIIKELVDIEKRKNVNL